MKVEDHRDAATNFISWKSRVLILEENDLLKLVNEKVLEPDAEEDKSHWRKSDARAIIILVDSVSGATESGCRLVESDYHCNNEYE